MQLITNYLKKLMADMELRLGCRIDLLEDRDSQFPAKIEFARNYARDFHVLRYNPEKCKSGYPLFGILLQSFIQLKELPNGSLGLTLAASGPEEERRFDADIKADPVGRRLLVAHGTQADAIEKMLLGGIIAQSCNQILEMLAVDVVIRDYPEAVPDMKVYLKSAALEGSLMSYAQLLEVYPRFIVDTNRILNLMFAMKCGEICKEKLIDAYKPTSDEVDRALDLYNFYRKERDSLKASGSIAADVLFKVLHELKIDRYARLVDREIAPIVVSDSMPMDDELTEEQRASLKKFYENFGDGKKDSDLMILAMLKVLFEIRLMPLEAVRSLALEVGQLAESGISVGKKYTLKMLPNRGEIWGSEILAYYYVTWAKVFPERLEALNLPYKDAYEKALKKFKGENGDNLQKNVERGNL